MTSTENPINEAAVPAAGTAEADAAHYGVEIQPRQVLGLLPKYAAGKPPAAIGLRQLGVDAECLHARAEEQALKPEYRDSFDIAVSRAVARLNVLAELCLPYVKPGGVFMAMKAGASAEELREAKNAIKTLGGGLERVYEYELDGVRRSVAVIRKLSPTLRGYPRRFARIQKQPL